jgi:hypothetical protein
MRSGEVALDSKEGHEVVRAGYLEALDADSDEVDVGDVEGDEHQVGLVRPDALA